MKSLAKIIMLATITTNLLAETALESVNGLNSIMLDNERTNLERMQAASAIIRLFLSSDLTVGAKRLLKLVPARGTTTYKFRKQQENETYAGLPVQEYMENVLKNAADTINTQYDSVKHMNGFKHYKGKNKHNALTSMIHDGIYYSFHAEAEPEMLHYQQGHTVMVLFNKFGYGVDKVSQLDRAKQSRGFNVYHYMLENQTIKESLAPITSNKSQADIQLEETKRKQSEQLKNMIKQGMTKESNNIQDVRKKMMQRLEEKRQAKIAARNPEKDARAEKNRRFLEQQRLDREKRRKEREAEEEKKKEEAEEKKKREEAEHKKSEKTS